MDIDNSEVDLISQFRVMNTNDKDHLIAEFKRLSNTELTNEGCIFYLDLAEWNLNTALWAYYEYDAPLDVLNSLQPQMKFMCDVTIGEGESVTPSTKFVKTWRIKNTGTKRWPYGCYLRLVNTNMSSTSASASDMGSLPVQVRSLDANEECEVSVELRSPPSTCATTYHSQYRLFTASNMPFGDPIWLVLHVDAGGVLGITQQLNSVNMLGASAASSSNDSNNNSFFSSSFAAAATSPNNRLKTNIFSLPITPTSPNTLSQMTAETTTSVSSSTIPAQTHIVEDEKRPDFYDDMFS